MVYDFLVQDSDSRAADQRGFDDDEEDMNAGSWGASRLQEILATSQLAFKEQHAPTRLVKLCPNLNLLNVGAVIIKIGFWGLLFT